MVNAPGNILEEEHLEPPLGLLSIASYAQDKLGIRPNILDLTEFTPAKSEKILMNHPPADIYGFTVYCTKWHIITNLITLIKTTVNSDALIILGGPNATAMPKETLEYKWSNIVVVGEGEKVFCSIVKDYLNNNIISDNKAILCGERLKEDEFPIIDRSFVNSPESYNRRSFNQPVINLEASRGCINRCIYCNSVVMGGGSHGIIVPKSSQKVIFEINESKNKGYNIFRFNDDSFTYAASKSGLLEKMAELKIRYRIFANAKHLTTEVLKKLKQSGCFHISVGVESYNPDNLKIIGKNTTADEICNGINLARKFGIDVRAYFIVGLPYDNNENIHKYMHKVAKEVNFSEYVVYPIIPYPGTPIWNDPKKFGYSITNHDFNDYIQIGKSQQTSFSVKHENFDEVDIQNWVAITNEIFVNHGKVHTINSKVI